ncbi:hypothetical protein LTR93_011083 [Exophiala xenobiotica]|nr:hypothetical protein LTR93_011083 [Exophiala xenobiotica]
MLNSLWYNLHYVFTSIGILTTAQALEPSHRSLLLPINPASIENGMQFLRSACSNSVLASRYVTLLEEMKDQPIRRTQMMLPSDGQDKGLMAERGNKVQTSTNRDS